MAVDRGIRVLELKLELELGWDIARCGDGLFDMFLSVLRCSVVSRHGTFPLSSRGREHEVNDHKRSRVTSIEYLIPLVTICALALSDHMTFLSPHPC